MRLAYSEVKPEVLISNAHDLSALSWLDRTRGESIQFWTNIQAANRALACAVSEHLESEVESFRRGYRSICSQVEFLLALSQVGRGRELLGCRIRSIPLITQPINLERHASQCYLSPRAVRVKNLTQVPQFVAQASDAEACSWLNSIASQWRRCPAESPIFEVVENGSQILNILTLNVWGLPKLFGFGAADPWRFEKIGEWLRNSDYQIVTLQEVWRREAREIIDRANFPYVAGEPRAEFFGRSGLVTLSRYPIIESELIPFPRSSGLEFLIQKGILRSRIAISETSAIDVYNVHLASEPERINRAFISEARANSVRAEQLSFLSNIIDRRRDRHVPSIVAGDFNIDEAAPAAKLLRSFSRYDLYRERYGNAVSGQGDVVGATFDPSLNRYARSHSGKPERIDYIFFNPVDGNSFSCRAERIFTQEQLSDHFGVGVSLKLAR